LRDTIANVARPNELTKQFQCSFVQALNGLVERRDFYREEYFRAVSLTAEAKDLLQRPPKLLLQVEVQRLNRLLLEASFQQELARSHKGCPHYSSKQFVELDDLKLLTTIDTKDVAETLSYMESLGPRQRKLTKLLHMMLKGYANEENGYEVTEIARQTGKHRTTVAKELHGTTENETDEAGREMTYHQAGAFDAFRAIYTNAIFTLEQRETALWSVVSRRDFSSDAIQCGFNKIAGELGISKRDAIQRYVEGWNRLRLESEEG